MVGISVWGNTGRCVPGAHSQAAKQPHPLMRFKWASLLIFLTAMPAAISPAVADSCSSNAAIASDMILKRQLAALKNMERGRGCTSESAQGGFFNACRDFALRRGEIQKQLQANAAALARCNAKYADPSALKNTSKNTAQTGKKSDTGRNPFSGQYSGTPLLFCVRLSDGYYFPAPHSQFSKSDSVKETLAQCRFICESPEVNLYVLDDPAAETADMLSVDRRESYLKLPTAYNYQGAENFQKCNWAKYFSYIQHVRTRGVKPKKTQDADRVLLSKRADPVQGSVAIKRDDSAPDRAVRIVGPAFLQDENDKPVNFLGRNMQADTVLR